MSEIKHTAEPWIEAGPSHGAVHPVEIDSIVPANYDEDDFVPEICHFDSIAGHEQNAANARRIVVCVNACKNLTNEQLEDLANIDGPTLDMLDKLRARRDELKNCLSALEDIATAVEADIDCGRPLEYNVEHLRDELVRARAVLGILPEQDQQKEASHVD